MAKKITRSKKSPLFLVVVLLLCLLPMTVLAGGTEVAGPFHSSSQIQKAEGEDGQTLYYTYNSIYESFGSPSDNYVVTNDPTNTYVAIQKTIEGTNIPNNFKIQLQVTSKQDISQTVIPANAALVLVLDTSGSMNDYSRLRKAKNAINGTNATDTDGVLYAFADTDNDGVVSERWVSVVTFNQGGQVLSQNGTRWFNVSVPAERAALEKLVSRVDAGGWTNVEAGLTLAKKLLEERPGYERYVTLLSDGATNAVNKNNYTGGDSITGVHNGYYYPRRGYVQGRGYVLIGDEFADQPNWEGGPDLYEKLGDRTLQQALNYCRHNNYSLDEIIPDGSISTQKALDLVAHKAKDEAGNLITDAYNPYIYAADRAAAVATEIREDEDINATIYTISLSGADEKIGYYAGDDENFVVGAGATLVNDWLKDSVTSSGCFYPINEANIEKIFGDITAAVVKKVKAAAKVWLVTDPMGEYIDLDTSSVETDWYSPEKDPISFDNNDKEIIWDLRETNYVETEVEGGTTYVYTMKYNVVLDAAGAAAKAAEIRAANPDAVDPDYFLTNGQTTLSYVIQKEVDGNIVHYQADGVTPVTNASFPTLYLDFKVPKVRPEVVEYSLTKQWTGVGESADTRPQEGLDVQLHIAGEEADYRTATLTAANVNAEDASQWLYTWNNLPAQFTYTVTETEPVQYTQVGEAVPYKTGNGATLTNLYAPGSVTITKDFAADSALVEDDFEAGAFSFVVKNSDGEIVGRADLPRLVGEDLYWTATVDLLPYGDYTVEETIGAKPGYTLKVSDQNEELTNKTQSFSLEWFADDPSTSEDESRNTVKTAGLDFVNDYTKKIGTPRVIPDTISVTKVEQGATAKKLAGAVFTLSGNDLPAGAQTVFTTNNLGIAEIKFGTGGIILPVQAGPYEFTLTETTPPQGYAKIDGQGPWTISVLVTEAEAGPSEGHDEFVTTTTYAATIDGMEAMEVPNTKLTASVDTPATLTVNKTETAENGGGLITSSAATFELRAKNGPETYTATTSTTTEGVEAVTGVASFTFGEGYLPAGEYTLKEITAPTGYKLSNVTYDVVVAPVEMTDATPTQGQDGVWRFLTRTTYSITVTKGGVTVPMTANALDVPNQRDYGTDATIPDTIVITKTDGTSPILNNPATFTLTKQGETTGIDYPTNDEGTLTLTFGSGAEEVGEGTYVLTEKTAPQGYTKTDGDLATITVSKSSPVDVWNATQQKFIKTTTYNAAIAGDTADVDALSVANTIQTSAVEVKDTIIITKTDALGAIILNNSATFTLTRTSEGEAWSKEYSTGTDGKLTLTFGSDANEVGVGVYELTEKTAPSGYSSATGVLATVTVAATPATAYHSDSDTYRTTTTYNAIMGASDDSDALSVKNTRQTGTLRLTKEVSGRDKAYFAAGAFSFQIWDAASNPVGAEVSLPRVNPENAQELLWSIDIPLPTGAYTVTETVQASGGDGWTSSNPIVNYGENLTNAAVTSGGIAQVTVTNPYTYAPTNVSLTAYKVWLDDGNRDGLRPVSVKFGLYAGDTLIGEAKDVTGTTAEANKFQVEFSYDDHDYDSSDLIVKEIGYTDAEGYHGFAGELVAVPGYTSSDDGNAANSFTITNSHVSQTLRIGAVKAWSNGTPQTVTFHLRANGVDAATLKLDGTAEGGSWSGEFTGATLYKYANGQPVAYTVVEESLGARWSYTVTELDTAGTEYDYYFQVDNRYRRPSDPPTPPTPPTTPPTDIPDEDVPLADIPEEEVPLADIPATGDTSLLFLLLAAFTGVTFLRVLGKERE